VKALQEQQSQIADLQARNTRLEAQLAALEARSSAGSGPWPFAAGGLLAVGAVVVARRRGEL
jgi:MYXO-CTERM domain-containing protein